MASNPYADLGAELIEEPVKEQSNDFSDLGAEPVQESDYSDLGAVAVEEEKKPNFFESILEGFKKKKEEPQAQAQVHQQQVAVQKQEKAKQDADPNNWSSNRFTKEAPKPQTFEEKVVYDKILKDKKDKEKRALELLNPTELPEYSEVLPRIPQTVPEHVATVLRELPLLGGQSIRQMQNNNRLIYDLFERPVGGLRAIAKDTPMPEGVKETAETFVKGFVNPENYPAGTFAESLVKAGNSPDAPDWIKPFADPIISGALGTIADAGYYIGVPEALGRIVTSGKVSLLKSAIEELNKKGAAVGKKVTISEEMYQQTAKNKDVFEVVDFYAKAKDLKIEIEPTLLKDVSKSTPKDGGVVLATSDDLKPTKATPETQPKPVTPEVLKEIGAEPMPTAIKETETPSAVQLPKGKKLQTFDRPDKDSIDSLIYDIQNLEAKKRLMVKDKDAPVGEDARHIVTGDVPKYLENQGVSKAKDIPILKKAAAGQPLTDKQHGRVLELIDLNMREQERRYGKSIEELYAEISERESAEARNIANQIEPISQEESKLLQESGAGGKLEELGGGGELDFPFGENVLKDYGPEVADKLETPKLEKLKNETLDQAIERSVGYQIENGVVKLEETKDGWKATISTGEKPHTIKAYKKQAVLNETYKYLNPDYGVKKPKQTESKELLGQATAPKGGLKAKAPQAESPLTEFKQALSGEKQAEMFPKPPSGTGFAAPASKPVSSKQTTNKGETKEWQPKVLPAEKIAKLPKTLGGMEHVRALEMPELVRLGREISGSTPKVVLRTGRALGRFINRPGSKGNIKLVASIFKDPDLAAGVLAHEIGHNIDWLPDETLKRGNVIGRAISAVGKFMKQTFGPDLFDPDHPTALAAKELRKELEALTTWWHPFTPVKGDSYTKYRFSSSELYAEFLSVLLNAPAKAQEIAPKFFNAFFEHLDKKPEVQQSFFKIQELLTEPSELLKNREEDMVKMFEKSRQTMNNILANKTAAKKSVRFLLKYHLIDRNAAILDARNKVAKTKLINPEEDPKYLLEENNMIGSFVKSYLDDFNKIYIDIQKSGLDFDKDFGEYLFLKRVMNDRSELANPLGHTPETAARQIDHIKERLGTDRFNELEKYVGRARAWFKEINNLLGADVLTEKQIDMVRANTDYAPFRVTKYLKEYASAGFMQQMGTLSDIENPAASLVFKGVAMLRLFKRNEIEKTVGNFLIENQFAEPAQVKTYDKEVHIKPKEGLEVIKWREKGKWKAAYVDPYIADSFKYDDSGVLQSAGEVLRKILLNDVLFRPVFITYNLGFQSFNLVRDFARFWKNTPDLTFPKAVKNYVRSVPTAYRRIKGKFDPLIQQMEREGALNITMSDMFMGKDKDSTEIDAILSKYGMVSKERKPHPLLRPLFAVLDGIKFTGDVIETIPKVAGFKSLDNLPAKERANYIRNYIGTPNFKTKGKMYPIYNNLFLFSNIIKQGLRSDFEAAFTNPKTRQGYWWKTIKMGILPKILMGLGAAGLFGKAIKDNYEKQTEYDKSNYITLPLGEDERGKALYMRIPQDETTRLISGIFWKSMSQKDFKNLFSFTAGQIPSMSPMVNVGSKWAEFLSGENPKDSFRNREILTDDEAKAGGFHALEPMARWTLNQTGLVHLDIRDRLKDETVIEKTLAVSPVLNRWLRLSDYGQTESSRILIDKEQKQEAIARIETKESIREAIRQGKSAQELARQLPYKDRKEFIKKFNKEKEKPTSDSIQRALAGATSNNQKLAVFESIEKNYPNIQSYRNKLNEYYKDKSISIVLLRDALRQYNKNKRSQDSGTQ